MQDARWLTEAWREFGERELAGARDNPRIVALFRDAGHATVTDDETAWCAAFCGACLERAGVRATRSLMARSYLAWGEPIAAPRMGAVAVFSRGTDPALGHVGFWLGETGGDVVLLGGNQGNAVSVGRYPRSRLLGLRWPGSTDGSRDDRAERDDVFTHALAHVLAMEGGYTDDPHDPGGPTHRGITLAVFAAWRGLHITAASRASLIRDLKSLDAATTGEIYRRRYWEPAHCADLPPGLALMHFDASVNHGVGTAVRILQEAVGAAVDGDFGPETRAASAAQPRLEALTAYAEIRRRRYRALPHFWRFGRGWLARVDKTLTRAKTLASEPPPIPSKGVSSMPTTAPAAKWWGHSITIWGTIVTILSTVVPALAPLTGIDVSGDLVQDAGSKVIDAVQAVGALVGTLMTIYGRVRASGPLQTTLFKNDG